MKTPKNHLTHLSFLKCLYWLIALGSVSSLSAQISASIYGSLEATESPIEVYISFSENSVGLEDSDFVVVNGTASGTVSTSEDTHDTSVVAGVVQTPLRGRFYKTTIIPDEPGKVEITIPAGAVKGIANPSAANAASNTFVVDFIPNAVEKWVVDGAAEWSAATGSSTALLFNDGFVEVTAPASTFTSVLKQYPEKRKATSLTMRQSPKNWLNWTEVPSVGPDAVRNAPVFLPVVQKDELGNITRDYYLFGRGPTAAYHAWRSNDMINWTGPSVVTEVRGGGRWTTSAEYKDGTFYILYDHPNDQDAALYKDNDVMDGQIGEQVGMVFNDPSDGSDASLFRDDEDGRFHIIYEDWSPINARKHAWDSPLAGHTSTTDFTDGLEPHMHHPAVDVRTDPTDEYGTFNHKESGDLTYQIHEGEQNAFGDWTTIKVGSEYYLFGDYDPIGEKIRIGMLHSSSIYEKFEFMGSFGFGHPDPTVGFAEGKFYLIQQASTDFTSTGPWIDGVEARAGVDTDNDGSIDQWTDWQTLSESYDNKPGFSRVVDVTPAQIDLSSLPEGYGFQFEFRIDGTAVENISPIIDAVELEFESSNFQKWSNARSTPAIFEADHNSNGLSNLVEFALGQPILPQIEPSTRTLEVPCSEGALEDNFAVEVLFSEDLASWSPASSQLPLGVSLEKESPDEEGRIVKQYSMAADLEKLFWQISVSRP